MGDSDIVHTSGILYNFFIKYHYQVFLQKL